MVNRPKRMIRNAMTMTDIAFLLLLFFMVLSMINGQAPQQIHIPQVYGDTPENKEQQFRLYIMSDGTLHTEEGLITIHQYSIIAASELADNSGIMPVILADERTPFKHIALVLDTLRSLGAEQVGFLADYSGGTL